jgi:hypothetical protein
VKVNLINKITLYTIIHLGAAFVLWLLLLGVTGYGFKDELSVFDYVYSSLVILSAGIFTFPVWPITMLDIPIWGYYLLVPLQVLSSFIQVNVFLFLCELRRTRNKTI